MGGEDGGVGWAAGGERPPCQASEHQGLAGGKIRRSVVILCPVEQRPRPRQVTEATGDRCLTDHRVGGQPRVEAACDRLVVQAVGEGVVALPGP